MAFLSRFSVCEGALVTEARSVFVQVVDMRQPALLSALLAAGAESCGLSVPAV